jgi:SAM-dependent methyltransferase
LDKIQQDFYNLAYEEVLNTGLVGRLQRKVHHLIDKPLKQERYLNVLELGSGNSSHLIQFKKDFANYQLTDLRFTNELIIKLKKEISEKIPSRISKVTFTQLDALNGDFPAAKQDLIIATCLLIHLNDPLSALKKWKESMSADGEMVIYVPCEPGILLRLARNIFTKPKHRKAGISDPSLLYALEHVTSFEVLKQLIEFEFADCQVRARFWPFSFVHSWNLNLFAVYHIKLNE